MIVEISFHFLYLFTGSGRSSNPTQSYRMSLDFVDIRFACRGSVVWRRARWAPGQADGRWDSLREWTLQRPFQREISIDPTKYNAHLQANFLRGFLSCTWTLVIEAHPTISHMEGWFTGVNPGPMRSWFSLGKLMIPITMCRPGVSVPGHLAGSGETGTFWLRGLENCVTQSNGRVVFFSFNKKCSFCRGGNVDECLRLVVFFP